MREYISNLRQNNRGYTMVTTLIAVAFVAVLGAIILSVSSMNLRMKFADQKAKMDFYSADTAYDEIYNGLGLRISEQVSLTYTDIMRKASNGSFSTYETQEEAYNAFRKNLSDELDLQFIGAPTAMEIIAPPTFTSLLTSFITANSDSNPDSASVNTTITIKKEFDASGFPTKYIFQDISVTYLDGTDNISSITSDIILDIPVINFFQEHDNLLDYAVLGKEGVYFNNSTSVPITVNGNVYAGGSSTTVPASMEYAEKEIYGGINVWNAKAQISGKYVVTKGNITVRDGADLKITGISGADSYANVWAETVRTAELNGVHAMQEAKLNVNANMFLANDLELNSYKSNVVLKGGLYGYNNKTYTTQEYETTNADPVKRLDHAKSSAVIINGKNCNLNMSGLDTMLLAGRAYIDLKDKSLLLDSNRTEYATGESLALKTNQFIYLAPAQYLTCSNPCNSAVFSAGLTEAEIYALSNKFPTTGWFGIDKGWVNSIQPVTLKKAVRNSVTYYYFYLNFTMDGEREYAKFIIDSVEGSADTYVSQAYEIKKRVLEKTFSDLIANVTIASSADCRIYGQGLLQETLGSGSTGQLLSRESNEIGKAYKNALSLDVIADATVKLNNRYEWLYNLLEPNENYAFSAAIPPISNNDYKAKVYTNSDGSPYYANDLNHKEFLPLSNYVNFRELRINGVNKNHTSKTSNQPILTTSALVIDSDYNGIILCDGDVTVKNGATVRGIIVSTGKVYLQDRANVISDRGIVQAILNEELARTDCATNKEYACHYMTKYVPQNSDSINEFTTSSDYKDWISNENWRKGE